MLAIVSVPTIVWYQYNGHMHDTLLESLHIQQWLQSVHHFHKGLLVLHHDIQVLVGHRGFVDEVGRVIVHDASHGLLELLRGDGLLGHRARHQTASTMAARLLQQMTKLLKSLAKSYKRP